MIVTLPPTLVNNTLLTSRYFAELLRRNVQRDGSKEFDSQGVERALIHEIR